METYPQKIKVLNIDRSLFSTETIEFILNIFTGRAELAIFGFKNEVTVYLLDKSPSLSLARVLSEKGINFDESNNLFNPFEVKITDRSAEQLLDEMRQVFDLKVLSLSEEKKE